MKTYTMCKLHITTMQTVVELLVTKYLATLKHFYTHFTVVANGNPKQLNSAYFNNLLTYVEIVNIINKDKQKDILCVHWDRSHS